MGKFQNLLNEYGESHQNATNKSIHWICVPLIFWAIVALLYSIPNQFLIDLFGDSFLSNWSVIAMIAVLIYYVSLSIQIAIGMSVFAILCLLISELLSQIYIFPLWTIATAVFVLAWVFQF